jgi:hypothetical protein
MTRRPDAFERRAAKWKKEHGMTVPDPTSPDCEQRKHTACTGDAWDKLKDRPADCTCDCHQARR